MNFNEQAVIEYVTKQRWYGAKSRAVAHSQVLDAVELRTTDPSFTLELVEMRYDTGAHDIYQLLHGETEIDGFRFGTAAHGGAQESLDLPESLAWLWRDYDPKLTAQEFKIDPAEKEKPFFRVTISNRDAW